ncbi:MAG TPA: transposase [Chlamydiales bacterium]|jgi:transposase|nr:transposase [Chlamydiales bacterium]
MFQSLTDAQWALLEPLFTTPVKRGRGKPHAPWRAVVNSILAVLLTGIKWAGLPKGEEFASKSASHRWFVEWDKNGFLSQMLTVLRAAPSSLNASLVFVPKRRVRTPSATQEASISFASA